MSEVQKMTFEELMAYVKHHYAETFRHLNERQTKLALRTAPADYAAIFAERALIQNTVTRLADASLKLERFHNEVKRLKGAQYRRATSGAQAKLLLALRLSETCRKLVPRNEDE